VKELFQRILSCWRRGSNPAALLTNGIEVVGYATSA
jgi:hypothetical protein